MPEVGVHEVREVERRRAARQVDDLALGRERVHAILEQLDVHALEKVRIRLAGLLGLEKPSHPLDLALVLRVA
jgi:hypothetical protein